MQNPAGFAPTLEIASRFPHSHRPVTAIYFSKNLFPKGAFLAACTFSLQAHSSIRKDCSAAKTRNRPTFGVAWTSSTPLTCRGGCRLTCLAGTPGGSEIEIVRGRVPIPALAPIMHETRRIRQPAQTVATEAHPPFAHPRCSHA